jgi:phosphate transport system substrate-binding protein
MKPPRSFTGLLAWRCGKARTILSFAAVLIAVTPVTANAVDISGAGATFPYPIYAKWANAFEQLTGNTLNYQSIGSGGGIKQVIARAVTFGASDKPLSPKELADHDLIQWPMVMGGIVPAVNIDGISANELTLDGDTLAKIYLGEIKTWDDGRIKKLNPEARLPSNAIVVIHRSDGSGTTFNFTNYLSKVNAEWKSKVGFGTAVEWPAGIGVKGSEGVANPVQQTKNAIGYVEAAYAKQNKLTTTKLVNRDGKAVAIGAETVQAAAVNADWEHAEGFELILTNQPGAKAWPIAASTFILMPKQAPGSAAAKTALEFFSWAYAKGDDLAAELDYVPLPESVKKLARFHFASIRGPDGNALCHGPASCCPDC